MAEWSPEERAGARCEICGNPAKARPASSALCQDCLDRYDEYHCSRCDNRVVRLKTISHASLCARCNILAMIDSLTEEQREAIRSFAQTGDMIGAIKEIKNILVSVALVDAKFIAETLADRADQLE